MTDNSVFIAADLQYSGLFWPLEHHLIGSINFSSISNQ